MSSDYKHFLDGKELNTESLTELLDLSDALKIDRDNGILREDLKGKTLAMLFDKPSLRTRMSFSVAMTELGGNVIESSANLRKQEEPEDVAGVLSRYVHAVMIRTHGHDLIQRFTETSKVPVINGLTDEHHPCQALADILTLKQKFGTLKGLKLAYIGDGNNCLHSLMVLAPLVGIDLHFACPAQYQPDGKILEWASMRPGVTGKIKSFKTPDLAVQDVDAIYTDVWTSMGFEEENEVRIQAFQGYQLNKKLHSLAQPRAIVLHCMPMVRGQEITSEMADHEQSAIYQQAENRLHVQKALLLKLIK
jgi:ornithine carbamoyltransferase